MTDETPTNEPTPDASAEAQTAPIEMPATEPAQAEPTATPTASARQGVPAWAVISGAAAAGLIVVAGVGGYAIGQANASDPIRDLPQFAAGGPMQPGGPMAEGDDDGDERGDGRGDHRDGWGQGRDDDQWEQDGPREGMRPQDDFGMQGPMQGISPQDLQQLLDLLMQSNGGRMPFDGQWDGPMNGPFGGQDGGQWGSPHGYSQGS